MASYRPHDEADAAVNDTAEGILAAAMAIDDRDDREAFVERACAGRADLQRLVLQRLVEREQARPTVAAPDPQPATVLDTGLDQVGPYCLIRKLGEGGMGVVYLAEQYKPVQRQVALKIIKPGLDTGPILGRFEHERRALAMMDHPSIARVLDAGTTSAGRPYFVMELVTGVPINHFAEQFALDVRQRLELFAEVCLAIQHAHSKGVIHRDIKPSNVLVTMIDGKPVPKVIDFGLAKALHLTAEERGYETVFGAVVGTPEYMAPEQAALAGIDADTRGDVYSLGVLLYHLLTATTPISRDDSGTTGMMELLRHVVLDDLERPSVRLARTGRPKLARQVRGELDWIVMKALEKDPGRRYQTALGLATDVRRYLAGEPVEAGPPSAWYRTKKFANRHRTALLLTAALALTLVVATAVSLRFAVEERRERRLIAEVLEFLQQDVLGQPGPDLQGRPWAPKNQDLKVREALAQAAERLRERFADRPRVEIGIRNAIGNGLREMGDTGGAEKQLTLALELAREALGDRHPDTLRTMYNLTWVYGRQARYAEVETLSLELVNGSREVLGRRDKLTLSSRRGLGWVWLMRGEYDRSETMLETTLSDLRDVCGPADQETLDCLDTLATCRRYKGQYDGAERLIDHAIKLAESVENREMYHHSTLLEKALLRACQGQFDEAASLSAAVAEALKAELGEHHPEARLAMREQAWILRRAGRPGPAKEILRKLIEADPDKVKGEPEGRSAAIWQLYAESLLDDGRFAEAEVRLRVVLRVYAKLYPGHWLHDRALSDLGASLLGQKNYAAAEPLLREGYEGLRRRKATLPAFEADLLVVASERLERAGKALGKQGPQAPP